MRRSDGGFQPDDLLPEASLNRTMIPDEAPFPVDLRGARGFDLLGAKPLARVPARREGVVEVARRLAALIASLVREDVPNSGRGLQPTPWRIAYLTHWSEVAEVWIGGGVAARFGPELAPTASRSLARYELGVEVLSHAHPSMLPLIGAARTMPGHHRETIVLDLGHSWVKRGVAGFDVSGALCSIEVLRSVPVDTTRTDGGDVIRFVKTLIEMTLAESPAASGARAAVAAYVTRSGVIDDPRSYYAAVAGSGHDLGGVSLVHDGTAAALGVDPSERRGAVVTLGTALGVGFVSNCKRRSLGRAFALGP